MLDRAPTHSGQRVLLVFTRDPRGRISGRKLVLRTILDSLITLGHRVSVAHFGRPESSEDYPSTRFMQLQGPTRLELARGSLLWLTPSAVPLNEVLYRSARAKRQINELITEEGSDVIVTDMVRTASFAEAQRLPWIADLDDLLSERYLRMADDGGFSSDLLGYHPSAALRGVQKALSPFGAGVLRREARLIKAREVAIARGAARTTLVSAKEASELTERAHCEVHWTPMSVPGPESPQPPVDDPEKGLVFLGGLDYQANLKSVAEYDRFVAPMLHDHGVGNVPLHVIGHAEQHHRDQLSSSVVLHGYVYDLASELRRYEAMLVPEVDPGGVKTKIIQAAFHGVIVLAHVSAVAGSGLTPGKNVIDWSNAEELANAIHALRSGSIDANKLAQSAFEWATGNFGFQHVSELWANHIDSAMQVGALDQK